MTSNTITIKLTSLQASHTIAALQEYSRKLLATSEDDPEGGEHEDYLIIQSVIRQFAAANH